MAVLSVGKRVLWRWVLPLVVPFVLEVLAGGAW